MSGLLGSIFSFGDDLKKRARGLLGDPLGYANATVGEFNDKAQSAARGLLAGKGGMESVDALGAGPHALGGLLGAIKVYHGSRHKFDAPDSSKIGTGEGAQAYGHGGYYAENPGVATSYMDAGAPLGGDVHSSAEIVPPLGAPPFVNKDGQYDYLLNALGRVGNQPNPFNAVKQHLTEHAANPRLHWSEKGDALSALKQLEELEKSGHKVQNGYLYEANLRWPDAAREAKDPLGPQHFLDWDKPLGQQHPSVRDAMHRAGRDPAVALDRVTDDMRGLDFRGLIGTPQGTAALRNAGIPGIAYMDAGSRAAGQGTRNYVTFDDALVELLSRNGLAIK
jgi:hypothetical protein